MLKNDLSAKKRMIVGLVGFSIICIILIGRLAYLQFIASVELQAKAESQQRSARAVGARRGTIYDASGEVVLAVSSTVYTVTVNPMKIPENKKEALAKELSQIFEIDYEKVLKRVRKKSSIETIIKKQDKEKTDELRTWMEANDIYIGINIDEDTKRYYPFSNLASHVIGFCGSDNQGLEGIEAKYEKILSGKSGEINSLTDAKGQSFGDEGEQYIEPTDGNDLVLTIDSNIQAIIQKHLEEACIDNACTDGGSIIAMNPQNGDILALANYPNYDLNNPFKGEKLELQAIWRNKAIADTYEPGSTFKLVTASSALEEGLADPDKSGAFLCSGGIEIAGVRIKCWRYYRPHGSQSLRQALMNSCNPVFIGLGQKIGKEKYYSYLEKFGFLRKTGIDLPR